jgi:HK97 gp10 family phage protein
MTVFRLRVVYNHLPDVIRALAEGEDAAVDQAARELRENIQAVAPVDTGYHRDHIYDVHTGKGKAEVRSGDGIDYPLFLEEGTSRMAARPHFRPAAEAFNARFADIVTRSIIDAIQSR